MSIAAGGTKVASNDDAKPSASTGARRQAPTESAAAAAALARFEKLNKSSSVVPRVFAGSKGATAAEIEKDEELRRLKMQANAMSKARQERERKHQAQLADDGSALPDSVGLKSTGAAPTKQNSGNQISFKFRYRGPIPRIA